MATQTKVSNPVDQRYIVTPALKWQLTALAALIVVLFMVWFMAASSTTGIEVSRQRAIIADAARYNGLAALYQADDELNEQRVFEADVARFSAQAAYYLAKDEANKQRAIMADAARYTGLAELFTGNK